MPAQSIARRNVLVGAGAAAACVPAANGCTAPAIPSQTIEFSADYNQWVQLDLEFEEVAAVYGCVCPTDSRCSALEREMDLIGDREVANRLFNRKARTLTDVDGGTPPWRG